jgi:hypothetical protein
MCSALVVLEHSCFALSENEIHLIDMEVTQGVPPMLVRMSLAQWMVQQVQALSRQTVVSGLKKVRQIDRSLFIITSVVVLSLDHTVVD